MILYQGKTCGDFKITNPAIAKYEENLRYFEIRNVPEFRIYGVIPSTDGKGWVRIPEHIVEPINPSITRESRVLSGGRIRFVTDSDYIALRCEGAMSRVQAAMCNIGASGFDVYMKRSGKYVHVGNFGAPMTHNGVFDGLIDTTLPKGRKEITINFPLFNYFSNLYIGLDKNSTLEAHPDYTYEKPVLFYGSSITHGGAATRPGLAYPSIISRRYDTNFFNLGLSGNCKAEDPIIEYLCSFDPSVFVLDYDHNAPDAEHLRNTHEKLYLAFRKAHPQTPVIMVSMPNGTTMEPSIVERRSIIFNTYMNAFNRGEKVIFIDGASLFGADGHDDCTTDGCHPNDIGFMRMADTIGKAVEYAISISVGGERQW